MSPGNTRAGLDRNRRAVRSSQGAVVASEVPTVSAVAASSEVVSVAVPVGLVVAVGDGSPVGLAVGEAVGDTVGEAVGDKGPICFGNYKL